jgi:hypothetical protein
VSGRSELTHWKVANRCRLGWRGPALWASGVSELRQWGATGRTTWMPVVGLADETSERGRLCGISLVRSSRQEPSTTVRPGGDDSSQGGVDAPIAWQHREKSEPWRALTRRKHRTNGWSKLSRRKITQALTATQRAIVPFWLEQEENREEFEVARR